MNQILFKHPRYETLLLQQRLASHSFLAYKYVDGESTDGPGVQIVKTASSVGK